MLSFDGLALAPSLEDRFFSIGLLCEVLKNSEALSSLYFGYGTGDFFMLTVLQATNGAKERMARVLV